MLLGLLVTCIAAAASDPSLKFSILDVTPRSDRWALLISTSRYWYNYRHASNALSLNHLLQSGGVSDDNILLFIADCPACNPRNYLPGTIFNNQDKQVNLYAAEVQLDFTGFDVTIQQFLPTLRGEYDLELTPWSRRLLSGSTSSLLVYLTGHGGVGFLKFQDSDYLYSEDLHAAVTLMSHRQLFGRLLIVVETCHAESMCIGIDRIPNVACVASSAIDEESFSHHTDPEVGVDVIDFFSYHVLESLRSRICVEPSTSLESVFSRIPYAVLVDAQSLLGKWTVNDFFCAE